VLAVVGGGVVRYKQSEGQGRVLEEYNPRSDGKISALDSWRCGDPGPYRLGTDIRRMPGRQDRYKSVNQDG